MASFTSDGVTIAYDDIAPAGPAQGTIVLIHGFASNRNEGWKRTGWYTAFERRGYRVIALDQRGHGESGKPHDLHAYERERLAADVLNLMDALGVERADVFGYSMGTRTALELAVAQPGRIDHLVLGGIGGKFLEPREEGSSEKMAQAMLADDPATITEPMLRSFRQFADEQGEDRKALAAMTQTRNMPFDHDALATLPMPVLVVAGAGDAGAGDPEALAAIFPHGHGKVIPGCDHFSAIPHALTKAAVFDFLDGVMDEDDFPPFE
ncbi:alpha/beta hydrolase [Phenylobacterium sp.]|jgi:pimeloyl-ACP methyl ester carboxylesterase|uniref:alpha/beta fold hydrolase n=1 Tax=Phenylobacterium sp. TaxID=1871053 RepID=UPI002F415E58